MGQSLIDIYNIIASKHHILLKVDVIMVLILSLENPRLWKVT